MKVFSKFESVRIQNQVESFSRNSLSHKLSQTATSTMNFEVGSSAEALDEYGYWAKCNIVEKLQGPTTEYMVSFHGWSRQWDRRVSEKEIRPTTVSTVFIPAKPIMFENSALYIVQEAYDCKPPSPRRLHINKIVHPFII